MPVLSIIILSYNTSEITKQCLDSLYSSLKKTPGFRFEILIVDNGSSDGSVSMLQKYQSRNSITLRLILNKKNVGYPHGNNQALKIAKGSFVLFLNSDTLINQLDFGKITDYLKSHANVGALTVKINLASKQIDPASHRGFPTVWNSFCYFLKLENSLGRLPLLNRLFGGYHLTYRDLNTVHEIGSPSGAFYLVKKAILDIIGGFDEKFFMYGEDLDLSMRIKNKGFKIIYFPFYKITHLKYASGLQTDNAKDRRTVKDHFYNSMKIFYDKYYAKNQPPIINKLIYFIIDFKKLIA
ncbi:MAG: Glycosyltransferase [Candidatus Roizmanbacteria bacterium GW2011_GWA2_36_23]|uniref:Glycosyltransferase n=1 Tax=Candidatus Roizmanbacteria bacterium GW2011_GWA2_36_23 TaxID=1618480 RepID=A0A0G0GQV6_9BACT|nr:MAG: Glycosyltransferase [Candidatus Roizmanbacteria bacterium GW2011_GWA2_36_23]